VLQEKQCNPSTPAAGDWKNFSMAHQDHSKTLVLVSVAQMEPFTLGKIKLDPQVSQNDHGQSIDSEC